ncbi:MAG: ATP-binding protein [Kiritimatiellaeota bacterium]|nr:ATP-binding protein [Kiritimatiellota bacterium]
MDRFFNFAGGNGKKIVCLYGEAGTGRRTAVKRFADEKGKNILFIDTELFKSISPADLWEELGYLIRECLLENALPCFYNTGCLRQMKERNIYIRDMLRVMLRDTETVFLVQDEYDDYGIEGIARAHFEVRMPGRMERAALWGSPLPDVPVPLDVPAPTNLSFLANAFVLSPKQIEAAKREAFLLAGGNADMKTITACCYHQTVSGLAETADKVPAAYGWDDIILPPETKKILREACNHIKYSDVVLEKWGMKKRAGYGIGLNIMFAGPPGTGKTMAAQVAANELNMDLYRIDTSKIVSKYIGETEKHLRTVFDEGRKANVILFFDEMDSLFGARTEIKDAHDKYANMQTAYILQRIEEYEGVLLMATNLINNIDEAFMRRIQYVLYFTLPAPGQRHALWQGMFPREAPLHSDIDFAYLAENYEISGGVIKNIVISAAFCAASEQTQISMKHVVTALQIELAKQGKVLIKEDLGRYSHYFAGF